MTSSRPYLIRAIYDWLIDNKLSPYLSVDTTVEGVQVPTQYIEDNNIILSISPGSVRGLSLGNDVVKFAAQFSGVTHFINLPVMSVEAIYAFENGKGLVFNEENDPTDGGDDDTPTPPTSPPPKGGPSKSAGRPDLKIVK